MSQNGKGDTYRPVDRKKFAEGWERVWGKHDQGEMVRNTMDKLGIEHVEYRGRIVTGPPEFLEKLRDGR